ncbi:MAG: aminotransferase class III-fold pyridoxal phosphate-dependent enzyme, partial [bacterium]
MTNRAVLAAYGKYVLANYPRVPIALVRGRGAWVWDAAGRRYLDMVPGIGAGFLGHCHPAVV